MRCSTLLFWIASMVVVAPVVAAPEDGLTAAGYTRAWTNLEDRAQAWAEFETWSHRIGDLEGEDDLGRLRRLEGEAVEHVQVLRAYVDATLDLLVGLRAARSPFLIEEAVEKQEVFSEGMSNATDGLLGAATILGMIRVRIAVLGG